MPDRDGADDRHRIDAGAHAGRVEQQENADGHLDRAGIAM
jgi:hypothetical protein